MSSGQAKLSKSARLEGLCEDMSGLPRRNNASESNSVLAYPSRIEYHLFPGPLYTHNPLVTRVIVLFWLGILEKKFSMTDS